MTATERATVATTPAPRRLVLGRRRFELRADGRLWVYAAVGRSGQRWVLEPFDRDPRAQVGPVRAWLAAIAPELLDGGQVEHCHASSRG